MSNMLLMGILAYIALQLSIGLYVSRRTKNEADYLLAGRRLPFGITMMSIFATWFGAETCIGSSGRVYSEGLAGGRADPFGYAACVLFMGLVFAVPFWRRQLTTLGDLFRERYSIGVERVAVILLVPTSVMWAAAQVRAFGQILSASSDMNVDIAITAAAGVVILYTMAGGLLADAITDVLQGFVLILGLVIMLGVAVFAANYGEVSASLSVDRLNPFRGETVHPLATMEGWLIPIVGSVLSQELISRTLAAKSAQVARRASLTAAGLYLLVGMIPVILGLMGPSLVPGLEDSEQFLPAVAQKLLHPVFYVIFAGALISAILSTVDSAMLAAAALTSHNLILPLLKDPSERTKLLLARVTVFFCGVAAYVLARSSEDAAALVEEASAFGSAGIFVVVVFALFTRLGGTATAYVTLILAGTVYFVGAYLIEMPYAYLASLAVAVVSYLAASRFEPVPAPLEPAPADSLD